MSVEIDVEHARKSVIEQIKDPEHRIIQETKTAGAIAVAVMRSAGQMVHDAAVLQQQRCRFQCTAAGRGRATEHLRENRIVVDTDIVTLPYLGTGALAAFRLHQSRYIIRIMEAADLLESRDWALDVLSRTQPAHCRDEIQGRRDTRNRQRMTRSVTGTPVNIVGDKAWTRLHMVGRAVCRSGWVASLPWQQIPNFRPNRRF